MVYIITVKDTTIAEENQKTSRKSRKVETGLRFESVCVERREKETNRRQ